MVRKSSKFYIITAVHNDLDNLKKLLSSIEKQKVGNLSILVVDDGSTDGVEDYLSKKYPQVIILKGNGHLWWTGAINKAIKYILANDKKCQYILTINNDCELGDGYLKNIFNLAQENLVVGSKIIDLKSKKLWDLGVMIDWQKSEIKSRKLNNDQLDAITTKGTLYPIKLFEKIGLLSSKLPHYLSDYEISIRAKNNGYKLLVCDDCVVLNETENTGIGDETRSKKGLKNILELAFSRKSKVNVFDQFWFITLACPNKYKFKNYIILIAKSLKAAQQALTVK